jgi:hypothetical protein
MTTLQLIPNHDAGVGDKEALLPALRAGIDSTAAGASPDGRTYRRRRNVPRLRFADLGLRPFRVY